MSIYEQIKHTHISSSTFDLILMKENIQNIAEGNKATTWEPDFPLGLGNLLAPKKLLTAQT